MIDKNIISNLSLCKKAGKLCSGEFQTLEAIKKNKAYLVIVPEDASNNTKKKFKDKCTFYNIDYIVYGNKFEIGSAIGTGERTSVAIVDKGFANMLKVKLGDKNYDN